MFRGLGERLRVHVRTAASVPNSVCQSLASLALVLTAGGLTLDLPRPLLVCAVADCTVINLHLSAGWYHFCVCVAVWTCGRNKKNRKWVTYIMFQNGISDWANWIYLFLSCYVILLSPDSRFAHWKCMNFSSSCDLILRDLCSGKIKWTETRWY